MALVVFCGQPCSGKSTIAALLVKSLTDIGLSVKLIDEPTLNLDRNKSYSGQFVYTTLKIFYVFISYWHVYHSCDFFSGMPAEKNLRGLLRSEVDRSVSKDSIVIVDSLNNIKVTIVDIF